jgi:hypothetical protein
MELRRIRDEMDARQCLAAAAASGLTRAAWAREHGAAPRSLNIWRVILDRRAEQRVAQPLRLVEVTGSAPAGASYAVCVGAYRVEFDDTFDDRTLDRVPAVISAC